MAVTLKDSAKELGTNLKEAATNVGTSLGNIIGSTSSTAAGAGKGALGWGQWAVTGVANKSMETVSTGLGMIRDNAGFAAVIALIASGFGLLSWFKRRKERKILQQEGDMEIRKLASMGVDPYALAAQRRGVINGLGENNPDGNFRNMVNSGRGVQIPSSIS